MENCARMFITQTTHHTRRQHSCTLVVVSAQAEELVATAIDRLTRAERSGVGDWAETFPARRSPTPTNGRLGSARKFPLFGASNSRSID